MPRVDTQFPLLRTRHDQANREALGPLFQAQRDEALARYDAGASVVLPPRWDRVVADTILTRKKDTASEVALLVADAFGSDYNPDVMGVWLDKNATFAAFAINESTRSSLADAGDLDAAESVFGVLLGARLAQTAHDMVVSAIGFGARDAAQASGAAAKRWQTHSSNPRSAHAAMNGQVVPVGELFSNRMDWPGDPDGGADQIANCQCSMTIL